LRFRRAAGVSGLLCGYGTPIAHFDFRHAAGASGLRGRGPPIARFLETPAHAIALTHSMWGAARLVFASRLKRTVQTIL